MFGINLQTNSIPAVNTVSPAQAQQFSQVMPNMGMMQVQSLNPYSLIMGGNNLTNMIGQAGGAGGDTATISQEARNSTTSAGGNIYQAAGGDSSTSLLMMFMTMMMQMMKSSQSAGTSSANSSNGGTSTADATNTGAASASGVSTAGGSASSVANSLAKEFISHIPILRNPIPKPSLPRAETAAIWLNWPWLSSRPKGLTPAWSGGI